MTGRLLLLWCCLFLTLWYLWWAKRYNHLHRGHHENGRAFIRPLPSPAPPPWHPHQAPPLVFWIVWRCPRWTASCLFTMNADSVAVPPPPCQVVTGSLKMTLVHLLFLVDRERKSLLMNNVDHSAFFSFCCLYVHILKWLNCLHTSIYLFTKYLLLFVLCNTTENNFT